MASMVREDFAVLMAPAAAAMKILWDDGMEAAQAAQKFRQIFNVETSTRAYEVTAQLVGFGNPQRKKEIEPIRFDAPQMGRAVTYVHNNYALGVAISQEAVEDDQSNKLVKIIAPGLVKNCRTAQELQAVAIFNNGFTVQGYEPEKSPARALFANNHNLIRPSSLGSTNSNLVNAALSYSALNTARILGRKNLTENGVREPLVYKYLLVPPGGETQANTLMRSVNVPNNGTSVSAPNDVNDFKNSLEVVVWDYLTDDGRWYMLTEKQMQSLKWFDRRPPHSDTDYDKKVQAMIFLTSYRASVGFDAYNGTLGSPGS